MNLPAFSEPPINRPPSKPPASATPSRVTLADVAMKVAHDGPMYCVIGLVGALAIRGTASGSELVITSLGALLARSWPRPVQIGAMAIGPLFIAVRHLW
jgi:hypothetical protein